MIGTIFRIGYLNLKNGDSEIVLTLTVPLVFLSIFALIFDNGIGGGSTGKVKVVLVNEDDSAASVDLISSLGGDPALRIIKGEKRQDDPSGVALVDLEVAKMDVGNGLVKAAIAIPSGWGASLVKKPSKILAVKVFSDSFDPVAKQIVSSIVKSQSIRVTARQKRLQAKASAKAGMAAATDPGREAIDRSDLPERDPRGKQPVQQQPVQQQPVQQQPVQQQSVQKQPVQQQHGDHPLLPALEVPGDAHGPQDESVVSGGGDPLAQAPVEIVDFVGDSKQNPILSSYAAGIVVVFVLFSATGFAGTLLDENETQTLERLLNGRVSMLQLLAGKWLFIFCIGFLQVICMFLWAMFYGINFTNNVVGFLLVTVATVAAATSFALVLATFCKTRGQLNTVSMIVILTMSAMGGSMVPRYIMSETMQTMGRITFNAWALDGYNKVFWYGMPVSEMLLELSILLAMAIVFFCLARLMAVRWEQVA
jgi:ABC-2 type transport system permease protein